MRQGVHSVDLGTTAVVPSLPLPLGSVRPAITVGQALPRPLRIRLRLATMHLLAASLKSLVHLALTTPAHWLQLAFLALLATTVLAVK